MGSFDSICFKAFNAVLLWTVGKWSCVSTGCFCIERRRDIFYYHMPILRALNGLHQELEVMRWIWKLQKKKMTHMMQAGSESCWLGDGMHSTQEGLFSSSSWGDVAYNWSHSFESDIIDCAPWSLILKCCKHDDIQLWIIHDQGSIRTLWKPISKNMLPQGLLTISKLE